jgi:hypothetical protein
MSWITSWWRWLSTRTPVAVTRMASCGVLEARIAAKVSSTIGSRIASSISVARMADLPPVLA